MRQDRTRPRAAVAMLFLTKADPLTPFVYKQHCAAALCELDNCSILTTGFSVPPMRQCCLFHESTEFHERQTKLLARVLPSI